MALVEPSWISTEPQNHAILETLVIFVNDASSQVSSYPANIQELANATIERLCTVGTKNPSIDHYRRESRVLFAILLNIVTKLNHAAVELDCLIKLVLSFREVPLPASVARDVDPQDLDSNMNEDLNNLRNVLSDFIDDAPLNPRLESRPYHYIPSQRPPWRRQQGEYLTGGEWESINAFIARLHVAAPDLAKLDLHGLYAMIEALEQQLTSNQLDDVLPAAAAWIIYAGSELRNNDFPYAYYPSDGGSKRFPWSKGELWTGRHAFNQKRWQFWMQRFKEIAEREDVSDTVRQAAWQAFEAGSRHDFLGIQMETSS